MSVTVSEINKTFVLPLSKKNGKEIFYPESDGKSVAETEIHIKTIFNLYGFLQNYFSDKTDVAVIADMMFYYEEGNRNKSIAPDVMVIKGVHKNLRRVFKLWEENVPEVIFEISSRGTWKEDFEKKFLLYESFGVKEYYIFDPEYDYLEEPFNAFHLKGKSFKKMKVKNDTIFSPSLNLEIVMTSKTLRLFNPETKEFLPTMEELESEVERLKAELAKLKRQN